MVNNNIVVLNQERSGKRASCQLCPRKASCPAFDQAGNDSGLERIQQRTVRAGEEIFAAGTDFAGVYVVRSGFFKSSLMDSEGLLQVTGFHFPGELFGLDGIDGGRYGNSVQALDTGSLCRIPLEFFMGRDEAVAASRSRALMALVRLMSRAVARDNGFIFALARLNARQRFAAFLLDVAERMGNSGYDRNHLQLCMSRTEIANYLGLAVETVSRLFTQFQGEGLLDVQRRDLRIPSLEALQGIVRGTDEAAARLVKVG